MTGGGENKVSLPVESSEKRNNQLGTTQTQTTTSTNADLCSDCEVFQQCQYARDLSFSQTSHLGSHKLLGHNNQAANNNNNIHTTARLATSAASDRHVLAEKLKLRYKTCPFHREISLG